jgi:diaminohydroxyphosphoribosylaminopyrimidine deaminase/5-amino-6-(5-phosphoribosylamino)uracil reductase
MAFNEFDRRCMARALELAALGMATTDPNPRVGSVITRGSKVIGEGWHERAGHAHAEVIALVMAGDATRGATVYVTLEPCAHFGRTPPCADALVKAGVGRVVCAMIDPNPSVSGTGIERLKAAGITVESGLMEAEARALNPGFIRRMERGLPWVRIKLGASIDGRTALASGASRWITSEESRADVQTWRARSSVILTGSGTVLEDNPRLDVRAGAEAKDVRQPLRVILDTELRTPPQARILDAPGRTLILTGPESGDRGAAFETQGVSIESMPRGEEGLDLRAVLNRLTELEANEIWVECGPRLAGSFVREGLADELVLYFAPSILGSSALGMFEFPSLTSLDAAVKFEFRDVRRIGPDLRVIAARKD